MDLSQIPPETLQQVMQTLGITDPNELMQLIQDNPQAAQQVLSMIMGGSASGASTEGSDWVEGAADEASGATVNEPQSTAAGDESESDAASPPADASASPAPMQDDEAAEGEAPMPASGRGGTVDDLISAQMMQRAAGDPNAAVPRAGGRGKNPRMPLKGAPQGGGQQAMIAELYRQMAAKQQQPRR